MRLLFDTKPATTSSAPYRLPAGMGDPDEAVGGGYSAMPDALHRSIPTGGNVGLQNFRAFHYGERTLPGRRYMAFIPPRGFSEWLR